MAAVTARLGGRMAYGGDYNPEQWEPEVWKDDVRLMRQAGVNLVSLGIFSWGLLEPAEGRYELGWLDEVMDRLHAGGVAVDLATATASPPAWLVAAHPEMLPVDERGTALGFGARQSWSPASPVYREHSLRLVERMATRYKDHPALAMWHVSNELGCHNSRCYSAATAAAFREWLRARYVGLDELNEAWGTRFWSQTYTDWQQVEPPRAAPTFVNPGHQLDFARYSSDALLAQYLAERDVLHRVCPGVPVTTNFMVNSLTKNLDYAGWAPHMDLVSNDHYLLAAPSVREELAFSADLTRGVAGGEPWLLMEHSTSAVNWGQVNRAKSPGEMRRNSLTHVARGSDGALFFQWRASRAGSEKYHSAMVPHAGEDSRVHREVVRLGADLAAIGEVAGSRVDAQVRLLFDWPSWWASEIDSHPSQEFRYVTTAVELYRPFWARNHTVDVVPVTADLTGARLVLVPALYLVDDDLVVRLTSYVEGGGTVLITYFSGIVDPLDHVRLGGYPGAFRDLLGVRSEEFAPLRPEERFALSDGSSAVRWTEDLHLTDAEALVTLAEGPLAGRPVLTRRTAGAGSAWYLATWLEPPAMDALAGRLAEHAGLTPVAEADGPVELVRRVGADGTSYTFCVNHGTDDVRVAVAGVDLLSPGAVEAPEHVVPAGGVSVVRS